MKKKATSKRTTLPRAVDYARSFHKDWARLSESGRFDLNQLKEAMLLLIANDGPFGPEWKDHSLTGGNWIGHRECHVGGDFLLAYKLIDDPKPGQVIFVRAGTHSELFG